MPAYDAFLLVSFGGPEGPAEVIPFLQREVHDRLEVALGGRALPAGV